MIKGSWKKLSSKVIHKNPWFKLVSDKVIRPDGNPGNYTYLETNGPSVYTVALDEDEKFYIVGLERYTSGEYSWELPAGNSDGEEMLAAAKRELKEETGLTARSWKQIGDFWAMNGIVREKCFVFLARDLKQTDKNEKETEGITSVKVISFGEFMQMVKKGNFSDGQSIAAITIALTYLGKL